MLSERRLKFIAASVVSAKLRREEEGRKLENLREKYLELRRGLFQIRSPRDKIKFDERVEEARAAYCAKWSETQDEKIFVSYEFDKVAFACKRDLKGFYELGLLDDWDMWRDWAEYEESQRRTVTASYEKKLRPLLENAEKERVAKALRKKERRRERLCGKELA